MYHHVPSRTIYFQCRRKEHEAPVSVCFMREISPHFLIVQMQLLIFSADGIKVGLSRLLQASIYFSFHEACSNGIPTLQVESLIFTGITLPQGMLHIKLTPKSILTYFLRTTLQKVLSFYIVTMELCMLGQPSSIQTNFPCLLLKP